ncbi:MAG: hypothetical protein AAF456_05310 [Planctomycetota bacterium]
MKFRYYTAVLLFCFVMSGCASMRQSNLENLPLIRPPRIGKKIRQHFDTRQNLRSIYNGSGGDLEGFNSPAR